LGLRCAARPRVRNEYAMRDLYYMLAVFVLAIGVYANALHNGFIPDDEAVVTRNDYIRGGGGLTKLLTREYFEVSGERTYRPVNTLIHCVEYRVWGLAAWGYHLTSVLIHAAGAALLYLLVRRLFGRRMLALVAALLLAVHPAATEAVNGIGYREDALALPWMAAAWLLYLKWSARRAPPAAACRTWSAVCLAGAWACFILSLLAKEITVGLPVLILACDVWQRGPREDGERAAWPRRAWACVRAGWPAYLGFFAIAACFVPLRLWIARTPFEAAIPYTAGGFGAQQMMTPGILVHYLRLMLWPVHQCADPWFGSVAWTDAWRLWGALAGVALAVAAALWVGRRSVPAAVGLLWFAVTLAPAANLFPMVNPAAERYLYVPCAGFCMFLAVPFERLAAGGPRRWGLALSWTALVCMAVLTLERNTVWRDDRRLNVDAIRNWPKSARAQCNLGVHYAQHGLAGLAIAQQMRVTHMVPTSPDAFYHLGEAAMTAARHSGDKDMVKKAIASLGLAARFAPGRSDIIRALGRARLMRGQYEEAEATLKKAIALGPAPAGEARMILVRVYAARKRVKEAMKECRVLMADSPVFRDRARQALARLAFESGDVRLARALLEPHVERYQGEALVITLDLLGGACYQLSDYAAARTHLERAAALRPNAPTVLRHLAHTYEALNMWRAARATWLRVVRADPGAGDARERLRRLGWQAGRAEAVQQAVKP